MADDGYDEPSPEVKKLCFMLNSAEYENILQIHVKMSVVTGFFFFFFYFLHKNILKNK